MSEIDYEELVRSPLDDLVERSDRAWSVAVIGLALGLVLGYLVTAGESEPVAVSAPATTTSTTTIQLVETTDYPAGYIEIAPGLAARANEVILGEEVITVGFTTAVKRGDDPTEADRPVGGVWLLETGSGTTAESTRVVFGRYFPGGFSVQFAASDFGSEVEFESVRMLERWDAEAFSVAGEVPFDGDPIVVQEPLILPVTQSVTLVVSELRLGRYFGSVEWETVGAEKGTNVHLVATLGDGDGAVIGSYSGTPEILEPADDGVLAMYWDEPFRTTQEGAVNASLAFTVRAASAIPASIGFDLDGVPVGR